MFEKFARSWALIKASASVLRQDKELLVFPAVSALATLLVTITFIAPLFGMDLKAMEQSQGGPPPWMVIYGFLFYFSQYFVIFFFNTALVGAAMIRLEGGDPTVSDGIRIATSKIGTILGYAAIAATVGMILRAIEERAPLVGRIVVALLGAAWTFITALTVPVLVSRDVGPIDAIKESAVLLKRTWGENLIGQGGVGVVFGLAQFLIIILFGALFVAVAMTKSIALMVLVGVIGVMCVMLIALVQAALSGIYSAALYRYAAGHAQSNGFDANLLQQAFRTK